MPQARKDKKDSAKIEVILDIVTPKKHSTRFETANGDLDIGNVYIKARGVNALGNPSAVKVTVEAADTEAS